MSDADEYEKRIREKVFNANILTNGEWVYLVGMFNAMQERDDAADRIEQLEAALREIEGHADNLVNAERYTAANALADLGAIRVILKQAALDQSSPPKTQPPPYNPDDWGLPPARQENDDVYPGFRGNNEA